MNKPKKIKIPRIEEDYYEVEFLNGKSSNYNLVLKQQIIAGLKIPSGSTIHADWVCWWSNHGVRKVSVPAYYVNRLLKYVYLEKLRNGSTSI